jgi:hypothetical protein
MEQKGNDIFMFNPQTGQIYLGERNGVILEFPPPQRKQQFIPSQGDAFIPVDPPREKAFKPVNPIGR